ncbi:MAG TPA: NAD(P)-dependent oxidoreductase, partial [Methanomicrobiales archaeon]|nr:NAD(P)-dependent oxidoreductase [Methanomicrobiales archaeon]
MPKIVFFDVDEGEQKVLSEEFERERDFQVEYHKESLNSHTVFMAKDADAIGVFIPSHVTEDLLDEMSDLRMIAAMSTGFDHIDIDACKARGITVSNVPSYGENTVAEYAFGLILSLSRKLRPTFRRVERGEFSRAGLMGNDIMGKTLGLIGTGHIGAHMARIGSGFGMKVIAYDVRPNKSLTEKYDVQFVSLEDLLHQVDIISLHVPYIPATHHMINAERLNLVKPGAFLINTSRGKVVDTAAAVEALRDG